MNILYGTTMAAIFALCIILLWTARRILQSSPLTSGELSLTGIQPGAGRNDFFAEPYFADLTQFDEPEFAEIDPNLIDPVAMEMMAVEEIMSEPNYAAGVTQVLPTVDLQAIEPPSVQVEPIEVQSMEVEPMDSHLAEEVAERSEIPVQPAAKRGAWISRHLPHRHNYWLECLLLGVSIVVLVQTQRNASRHRLLHSSDQVA